MIDVGKRVIINGRKGIIVQIQKIESIYETDIEFLYMVNIDGYEEIFLPGDVILDISGNRDDLINRILNKKWYEFWK